jgi:hypothetical protein
MEKLKDTILEIVKKLDERLTASYPVSYQRQFDIVLKDIPGMLNTMPNLEFTYVTPEDGTLMIYKLVFESEREYISVYVNSKRAGFLTYSEVVLRPEKHYDRLVHDLFCFIKNIEGYKTAGFA